MERLLIVGGPRTGKTTLALALGTKRNITPQHTDRLIESCSWSEVSTNVARWFDSGGPWIIEGMAVPRALRKWLRGHPRGTPADTILVMGEPKVALTAKQSSMGAGALTVWLEVVDELHDRGVQIDQVPDTYISKST